MYPITVKVSAKFLEVFREYEKCSYYDQLEDVRTHGVSAIHPSVHAYMVTKRYKTLVRLLDNDELEDFYYRLGSGITCEHSEGMRKTCIRIQKQLEPKLSPKTINLWKIV